MISSLAYKHVQFSSSLPVLPSTKVGAGTPLRLKKKIKKKKCCQPFQKENTWTVDMGVHCRTGIHLSSPARVITEG